ncbi:MAG: hypothetical protein ACI8QC_004481, partial [Planctomycetota bacterium]
MKRLAVMFSVLLVLGLNLSLANAQEQADRASARSRWESLSKTEQAELRSRYERLKKLPEAEREALSRRAQRLGELAKRLYRGLDEVTRERLDGLDPAQRRTLLHEMVAEEAREASQRVLSTLPETLRERVESANPKDREKFLRDYRRSTSSRLAHGMQKLGPELGISKSKMQGWSELPEDQRRAKFMELLKRKALKAVEREGLPKGLDEAAWKRIGALSPADFLTAFRRLRESHPELCQVFGSRSENKTHHLFRAMRPSPEERLELSGLPEEEREKRLSAKRRVAVMAVIREEKHMQGAELKELEGLDDKQFFQRVRKLLFTHGKGRRHGSEG